MYYLKIFIHFLKIWTYFKILTAYLKIPKYDLKVLTLYLTDSNLKKSLIISEY